MRKIEELLSNLELEKYTEKFQEKDHASLSDLFKLAPAQLTYVSKYKKIFLGYYKFCLVKHRYFQLF